MKTDASDFKILLADDEETFRASTAALLKEEGYECDCASDGDAVRAMLPQARYDLLVADLKMPGNPSMELIRDLPSLAPQMSVIIVTGYPDTHTAIDSFRLPVLAYHVKPLEWELFMSDVRRAARQAQVRRAAEEIQTHLTGWLEDLRRLNESFSIRRGEPGGDRSVQLLIEMTFRGLGRILTQLAQVTDTALRQASPEEAADRLKDCRPMVLLDAIRETIYILKKTQSSFKSKELGQLRQKLELLLGSQ